MPTTFPAAAFGLILVCSMYLHTPVEAQEAPDLTNDMISYDYSPPTSEKFNVLYERMKGRQVLERLAAFLSPLKLRGGLALSLEEGGPNCKHPNSYYDRRGTLHLCYSWFQYLE